MEHLMELERMAWQLRIDALTAVFRAKSGHPGGSFSAAEIITALYFHEMRIDAQNPRWPQRDRFILSKGHASPLLYAALARRGFFEIEQVYGMRSFESKLTSTPSLHVPGCDMSSGSLGQGLSAGLGMALAAKMDRAPYRVYVLVGDGECQEGQLWEAAMAAAYHRCGQLVLIVDRNHVQMCGTTAEIMEPGDLGEKFRAFGWNVRNIDGHDMAQVVDALDERFDSGAPTAIIAETVKGKGVSFMEGQYAWHGAAPNEEQYRQALEELRGRLK